MKYLIETIASTLGMNFFTQKESSADVSSSQTPPSVEPKPAACTPLFEFETEPVLSEHKCRLAHNMLDKNANLVFVKGMSLSDKGLTIPTMTVRLPTSFRSGAPTVSEEFIHDIAYGLLHEDAQMFNVEESTEEIVGKRECSFGLFIPRMALIQTGLRRYRI